MMNIHEKYVLPPYNVVKGSQKVVLSDDSLLSYERDYGYLTFTVFRKKTTWLTKVSNAYTLLVKLRGYAYITMEDTLIML